MPAVFFAVCILLALFILLHTIFFKGRGNSLVYGLAFHVFIFFTGAALTMLKKNDRIDPGSGIRHMQIRIDDYPAPATGSMKIPSTVLTIEGRKVQKSGRIIVYTGREFIPKTIKPGNIAAVNMRLRLIEDFDASDGFDYAEYMRRKGYSCYAFCNDTLRVAGDRPHLRHIGLRIRQQLANKLKEIVGDRLSLSVLTAMTLGSRKLVEEDTREVFRRSGIMHIMAVSGLHVGIIALFISL
ncbi:MAG TPA: ComEC/Rec2 family competence protein, partial [Bacteroidales bacterium]|nr:ComEC/Rec2 family competence protein [Bacteroidales bacterium]